MRNITGLIVSVILALFTIPVQAAPIIPLKQEVMLDLTIMGPAIATKKQCLQYLLRKNPFPLLTVSPEELVEYYYEEGNIEGIRPDVAFAQALHETGFFRYGGDVIALQNNYAGIGTTGAVVNNRRIKGHTFQSARLGVRAQIQHLLGYATVRPPTQEIVDPRYDLLRTASFFGKATTWTHLNGKWAVPGKTYGQKILMHHAEILAEK